MAYEQDIIQIYIHAMCVCIGSCPAIGGQRSHLSGEMEQFDISLQDNIAN